MTTDISSVGLQLLHLAIFAMVVGAPAPLVLYILAAESSRWRWPLSHTVLVGLLLWAMFQSLVVVILGWSSRLWLGEVLLLEGTLTLSGLWLLSNHNARIVVHFRHEMCRATSRILQRSPIERWLLALVATTAVMMAVESIAIPTDDYDSLAYHLPRVVQWYQSGTFLDPSQQFVGGMIDAYPYAWNTLFFLGLMALKHDQFILIVNLASWAMLGLAVYGLAVLAASRAASALLVSALVLLMPLSVHNVHTAHNDLPFSALFLSSIYFSIHAHRQRQELSVLMAVACAGMMLGTKMSGVACLMLLVLLWIWLQVWARMIRLPGLLKMDVIARSPLVVSVAVASVALLGASWYVRNALVIGNPLGYVQVSVLGRVVWDGIITQDFINRTNLIHNFRLTDSRHWAVLWQALYEQLGLAGLALVVAACLWLPRALRRQRDHRLMLLTIVGLCLASLYLFLAGPWSAKQPDHPDLSAWMGRQLRYTFHFWGLLATVVAASMTVEPRPLLWTGGLLATIGMIDAVRHEASAVGARHWGLAITSVACVVVLLFFLSTRPVCQVVNLWLIRISTWRRQYPMTFRSGVAVVGFVAILVSTEATVMAVDFRYNMLDRMWGGISRFVDEELAADTRLGFWGSHRSYLLYGRRLDRPVYYLPLDASGTQNRMKRLVSEARINFLAVGPATGPSPVWEWLANDTQTFQLVHGSNAQDDILVYRVNRPKR